MIAFVSEFVPRLYYTLGEHNDSLEGFVNHILSCFAVDDFPESERPSGAAAVEFPLRINSCGFNLSTCR